MGNEQIEDIHTHLVGLLAQRRAAAGKTEKALTRKLQALSAQTSKLMEGYYAGAVPLDLLKTEQTRITADRERVEETIS